MRFDESTDVKLHQTALDGKLHTPAITTNDRIGQLLLRNV